MPWKLSSRRSGSKSSAASCRVEVGRERIDVERIVVIRRQRPQRRLPAHPRQRAEHRIVRRRRRRRAILRIERRGEDARAAFVDHLLERGGNAGMAVAHRIMNADIRQPRRAAPRPGDGQSRAAASLRWSRSGCRPRRISSGRVRRMMPCRIGFHAKRMDFDHAPVAQELGEIAADRALLGRVGRAEVDQQHADLRLGNRGMIARAVMRAVRSNGSERIRLPDPAWIALATPAQAAAFQAR